MFIKNLFVFSSIILCAISCTQKESNSQEADGSSAINPDSMRMNIAILASDSFEGRKPFTRAEQKTISYIEQQYKNLGLEPGNGNSFLQEVPMVNIKTTAASTMEVKSAKGNFELKGFDDYVIWTDKSDSTVSFNDDQLVFAGYGVVAPEYNRNDYEGLDVKNKIVLIMVNDPGYLSDDTTLFKGKTMTYYGRWTYKFEEAARQGAKGCLIIHNTAAASYPFSVVQNNWNSSKLHLDDRGKNIKYADIIGWVSADAGKKLMQAGGLDTALLHTAWQAGFKPIPMGVNLSTSIKVETTYDKSHNVIAKITGSKRPDETIIYTAHWDHLGIGKADETGDSIYNGALDNASGVVSLIELARAFKSMKTAPERTIIFLAVTAEEQGLWGSAYYAQNPIYPAAKTVANINMDGITPFEKRKDYVIVGRGQNDLEDYAKDYAAANGKDISFETHPEAGSYYRSDHFNFAKVGIPALYMKTGIDIIGKGKAYGQQKSDEYTKEHYHRPSDEYDAATWHFEGGVEELKLLFAVGRRLAFETTMPKWKDGSEFKKLRND
ncbi:MAG: M28 family metallopeptidase [Ferruginibacter sp.]